MAVRFSRTGDSLKPPETLLRVAKTDRGIRMEFPVVLKAHSIHPAVVSAPQASEIVRLHRQLITGRADLEVAIVNTLFRSVGREFDRDVACLDLNTQDIV